MKRKYEEPEITVTEFEREDVMDINGGASTQGTFYEMDHKLFTKE